MKTFNQFLQEDFNSPKATQVPLEVASLWRSKKSTPKEPLLAFFEAMPKRPFNLLRYLRSFDSQDAKDILNNSTSSRWRGILFSSNQEFLVFVWKGSVLHQQVCQAIDKIAGKDKVPAHKYLKSYNTMNLLDPGETLDNNWCFPFVYTLGQIRTNLPPVAFGELDKQKGIKDLFQFDESQVSKILKDDL